MTPTTSSPGRPYGLQMMMCNPSQRLRLIVATRRDLGLSVASDAAGGAALRGAGRAPAVHRRGVVVAARQEQDPARRGVHRLLQERTGGWPAGLRLAARTLRDHPDPGSFVTSFSGDERSVADYLVCEVLESLADGEREVLRATSICDPLPGGLAVELSGREDAAELLDRLEYDTGIVARIDQQRSRVPRPAARAVLPPRRPGPLGRGAGEGAASSRYPLVQRAGPPAGRARPCGARRRPCTAGRAAPSMGGRADRAW